MARSMNDPAQLDAAPLAGVEVGIQAIAGYETRTFLLWLAPLTASVDERGDEESVSPLLQHYVLDTLRLSAFRRL
jgi:hypothetical protein